MTAGFLKLEKALQSNALSLVRSPSCLRMTKGSGINVTTAKKIKAAVQEKYCAIKPINAETTTMPAARPPTMNP